jgi:aldehyde:ferredoxin oxidoreductase
MIIPRQNGPNKGRDIEIETIISLYWEKHGWDPNTGIPTIETIKKLKLDKFFKELIKIGR